MLNRYGDDLTGMFTPNESSTVGTLLAIDDLHRAGKIKLVGFDSSDVLINALKAQKLQGLIVQNPFRMGELGVKTIVASLRKQSFEAKVDTGETLITPENMDTPESQRLLRPPLGQYLK